MLGLGPGEAAVAKRAIVLEWQHRGQRLSGETEEDSGKPQNSPLSAINALMVWGKTSITLEVTDYGQGFALHE